MADTAMFIGAQCQLADDRLRRPLTSRPPVMPFTSRISKITTSVA
jgi:hypothetical protein